MKKVSIVFDTTSRVFRDKFSTVLTHNITVRMVRSVDFYDNCFFSRYSPRFLVLVSVLRALFSQNKTKKCLLGAKWGLKQMFTCTNGSCVPKKTIMTAWELSTRVM